MEPSPSCHGLLAELEVRSRERPDRVLRLRGRLAEPQEPFELLIFRGFSSSVSHPTAFDPDQPALPAEARIEDAELLRGPLNPAAEEVLQAGPAERFLDPAAWL
ncbi:MAG: hypothetical protein ACOVNL_08190 [Prochlorococcaceae cyanobacterium]|jgi:hypothetical protein